MSTYNPDKWVMVKVTTPELTTFKVLAGWSGSYLYGASWKLNSGVTSVVEDGDSFTFSGYSGSDYVCRKSGYGLTILTASILKRFQEDIEGKQGISIEMLPEETDFMRLPYGEDNC